MWLLHMRALAESAEVRKASWTEKRLGSPLYKALFCSVYSLHRLVWTGNFPFSPDALLFCILVHDLPLPCLSLLMPQQLCSQPKNYPGLKQKMVFFIHLSCSAESAFLWLYLLLILPISFFCDFFKPSVNVGEDCPVFDGLFEFCQLSTGGSVGKC